MVLYRMPRFYGAKLKLPSNLADFLDSNPIGSYFEMAYGLWNAFKLPELPVGLSLEEITELENLSGRLTEFLQSDKVLRWFEMATIINYSGDYHQLLRRLSSITQEIIPNYLTM
jgi:hypothetical protein